MLPNSVQCCCLLLLLTTGFIAEISASTCSWESVDRGFYTFGSNCQYQCHCKHNSYRCNKETGQCKEGCEPGYSGPGCQYKSLAYKETVEGNAGRDYVRVVDGDITTCSRQDNPGPEPYVLVTMDNDMYVSEVIITVKNITAATGFNVYAGMFSYRDSSSLCKADVQLGSNNRISIMCTNRRMARYVSVEKKGALEKLEVCEIEVVTGRLLSFKRPTNASSEEPSSPHYRAVNGESRDKFGTLPESNPWFYVDLEQEQTITWIELIPREDMEQYIIGFQILLGPTNEFADAEIIYTNNDDVVSMPRIIYIPIDRRVGRFVWVRVPGDFKRLHMREISVYGGCRQHRCGLGCEDKCYCKDARRSINSEYTGLCVEGCERNWRDLDGFCTTSACGPNLFGYQCKYTCNCAGMCDPWTGACLEQSTRCSTHFYGPNCQGENIIRDSGVIQGTGSNYVAAPATVDGFHLTCAGVVVGMTPSWLATLQPARSISDVVIYINENNTGSSIEVMTETEQDVTPCSVIRNEPGLYHGRCHNTVANRLRLRARTTMQLCEVAVLDCADGTFGPSCGKVCLCMNGQPCNKVTGLCPAGGCEPGYRGETCERECRPGTYGHNCEAECGKCHEGAQCDIFTGDCQLPCQPGWQGGRCDNECRNGTFGADCVQQCEFCIYGEPCEKATGVCENGCAPGYHGANCSLFCEDGSYGYNCNMSCGNCSLGEICDRITGVCRSGCAIGLQPPLCQDACNHGTFGKDCIRDCGDCVNNETCNAHTGICDNGCGPGVRVTQTEKMCNVDCPNGRHGYNCSQKCIQDICSVTDVCNKKTGACLQGCLREGVQAPFCLTECCDGTYGQECVHQCGMCVDSRTCNKSTGVCPTGCQDGFVGPQCHRHEPALSGASVALLVLGVLLAIAGLIGIFIGYWIYKRGTLPWEAVVMRRKEKKMREEHKQRNFSIVSRVYENNMAGDAETGKLKRTNSNISGYKLSETRPRGTIAVEEFWDYVQDKKKSKADMLQQFKDLAAGLTHPCEVAKKAQNLRKNRYKEIFAYDHSRVKLDIVSGDGGNDYINACFISGYNKPHMYIAAQGPTEEFVNDFWRMIWQKNCRKVVMLTRLVEHNKVKCCQYWPDEGQKQYGGVTVEIKDSDVFADFTIRTFNISADGKEGRLVKHFHFESWSDRHVPEYASSVVHYWSKIRQLDLKDNVPTLVHCSAGIGRTGTFLALDYLVDQAQAEGYVNAFQCVQNLRHQRVNMVQNQDQYLFLHDALVEALFCPSTAIPCEKFNTAYKKMMEIEPNTKKHKLELEYEKLQHVTKFHDSMATNFYDNGDYKAAKSSVNADKNRTKHVLPSDEHRPFLTSRVQDRNDYINAAFLPSYRADKAFLVTQNPLPDTIVDFWRMVYEYNVCTIINMDRIVEQSEIYWPVEGETITFIPFQVTFVTEIDHVTHIERTIKLSNAGEPREKAMLIKQYECKFWMTDARVPMGGEPSILSVYEQAQKWQAANGNPLLVAHCNNGATKSGLFCATMATLDRLKQEKDVALQQTLKQMRINRHQIIPTFEQYKFCHDIIIEFLRGFDTFSNFYI